MTTADATLRRGLRARGDPADLVDLTLDAAFQGLPDTAHGGSVLAAFHAIAAVPGPAIARGRYLRRVPLDVPLQIAVARTAHGAACRLRDRSGALLVDGGVTTAVETASATTAGDVAGRPPAGGGALPLPVSSHCFVCGVDNALGLQARLGCDERAVSAAWTPRAPLATADGRLAPIALTAVLDEAAFWLGALASGESGMTTDLEVTLGAAVPFGGVIAVHGWRDRVRSRGGDPRYWDTEVEARDAAGRLLARAAITFVAVRGAARRLVTAMLRINPPEVVGRVFPAYAR